MQEGHRGGLKTRSQARGPNLPEDLNLPSSPESSRRRSQTVSASPRRPGAPSPAPPASSCCTPHPVPTTLRWKGNANASDVLSAMEEMEFQRFLTPLKEVLEAYRREQKGKKEASEQKRKDKDKKADSEEQAKSRDEDNDEMRKSWTKKNRMKRREWTTEEGGETPLGRNRAKTWDTFV
ncbi:hypothetical protein MJG53_009162 [Ovis ammon polii x Ovis aries]|uniref:Uncharacterized protein n=2 Tax=Ovis TaxID=9935 RepID=A0AAD4U6W8_OVIAM|nr:hypothetical protein MG293_010476 [Ovis ammon polii]KAI4582611.1 hypothetical protein MJG53_009162 [Ovis ammon polii x Ovis aries]